MAVRRAQRGSDEDLERHQGADRIAGEADHGSVAVRAGALGHAGLQGDLGELDPAGSERVLDHFVGARTDAAGGQDQVDARIELGFEGGEEGRDVVGDPQPADRDRAGVLDGGGQHVTVGVTDLAGRGCRVVGELGAGRADEHSRPGAYDDLAHAESGQQADLGRADQRPCGQHLVADGDVTPGGPDEGAGVAGRGDRHDIGAGVRDLDLDHCVGAAGERRSGHDPVRRTGLEVTDGGAGGDVGSDR